MSTNLWRMLGTLLVAVGLIAGSLGTAVAGFPPQEGPSGLGVLTPDGAVATDGGDGGDGGDTGTQNGGGANDNANNQGNGQDQTQTPDQTQDVTQGNDTALDQGTDLDAAAGGKAGGDCAITQPDDEEEADDEIVDDEVADEEDGAVINGDDGGDCAIGDSDAGDASTGDTNQANVGEADAANASSQDQDGGDQRNVNAPAHDNEQDLTNDLDAEAGDGADGGDAANSGDLNLINGIVATLVRIMASIIGDDNQTTVITPDDDNQTTVVPPEPTCNTITIVLTWGERADLDANLSGPDTSGGRFHVEVGNETPVSYASLDGDDFGTSGTETVTITTPPGESAFVAGDYHYWVHDYLDDSFWQSDAMVTVAKCDQQLAQFAVASATGDSNAIWHVFNVSLTATGEVTITPVQQLTGHSGAPL